MQLVILDSLRPYLGNYSYNCSHESILNPFMFLDDLAPELLVPESEMKMDNVNF